jgi:archaetidylinositol phosphate synthase
MDRDAYLDRWAEVHGGYDPRTSVWARTWLRAMYTLGVPLARAGVRPHALTIAGLAACALVPVVAGAAGPLAAAPVVVLSGLLDSLDGTVAVLRDRVSRVGYVFDSLADRVGEALYLWALWLLGAPAWLCALAGAATWLLEYTRARAIGAGMAGIGVVTVWERATRVAVTAAGLLVAGLVPGAVTVTAAVWAVLGVVGLGQLLVVVSRRLAAR